MPKRNLRQNGTKPKSIADFFQNQHQKETLRKQSEQNWNESINPDPGATTSNYSLKQQNDPLPLTSCEDGKLSLSYKRKLTDVNVSSETVNSNKVKLQCVLDPQENISLSLKTNNHKDSDSNLSTNSDSCQMPAITHFNSLITSHCDSSGKKLKLNERNSHGNDSEVNNANCELNIEPNQISEDPADHTSDVITQENVVGELTESEVADVDEFRVPYYLENFRTIIESVIKDQFYTYLFNEDDHNVISTFEKLSEPGQKLYVRIFGRIHRWLRKSKIVYPRIAHDLTETLEELTKVNLIMNDSELNELELVLKSLAAPELKLVAKSLKLSSNQVKEVSISAILKHVNKNNIGSFFSKKQHNTSQISSLEKSVLNRSKNLLGKCYKLRKEERSVFMRMIMLFSLHNTRLEDNDRDTGQQQIFQMLMSNIGKIKYPEYEILRQTKIFKDRASLIRFTSALQTETDIHDALDKKDFERARQIYDRSMQEYTEIQTDNDVMEHDKSLPTFLRGYTTCGVYVRVLSYGVELLQFTKCYPEAVELLETLVAQDVYHLDYRGRWCERLALNLDFHLKKPVQALDVIKQSLNDNNIRKGHRYAMFQRAQKICNTLSNKLKSRWAEFEDDVMCCVQQAPEVYIEARKQDVPGGFPLFISEDSYTADNQNVTFMKRVEDVALNYYTKQGYPQGIHAESGTFSILFALYFWDVIFRGDIADVFYNGYQTHPLDYYSVHFYSSRKDLIDRRLQQIKNSTMEELENILRSSWELHQDNFCVGVNWDTFEDVEHACGLLHCIKGHLLAAIFERFAHDMRFTRSGVPDLTVWNTETGKFKIVEVKGPGDRLSTKQILWLDYFLAVGIDAEVCYVKAIGAKKLSSKKKKE